MSSLPSLFQTPPRPFLKLSDVSTSSSSSSGKSKRGRKPKLPIAEMQLARKLKKQDLERRRRAKMAEKMDQIHALSLQLIGTQTSNEESNLMKPEKADILNLCHVVLKGIANVIQADQNLVSKIREEWVRTNSSFVTPERPVRTMEVTPSTSASSLSSKNSSNSFWSSSISSSSDTSLWSSSGISSTSSSNNSRRFWRPFE